VVAHATLTGAELHECKGADSASANTVRVSDGSGSGTWQKITIDSINTTSVKNLNRQWDSFVVKSTTDPNSRIYVPIDQNKICTEVRFVPNSTHSGSLTVGVRKNASTVASGSIASTSEGVGQTITVNTSYTISDTFSLDFSGTTTVSFTILISYTV
jgi:hypothetical protein